MHHCMTFNHKEDTDINDKFKHYPYLYMQGVTHSQ